MLFNGDFKECPKCRGITYCEDWKLFSNFHSDMGDKPEGLTIERIDNNKGYEKGNCRWATRAEQNRNQRHHVPQKEVALC